MRSSVASIDTQAMAHIYSICFIVALWAASWQLMRGAICAGYGYFRKHIRMFDPGWQGAQVKGIEDEDTQDHGNDPVGVLERCECLSSAWLSATTSAWGNHGSTLLPLFHLKDLSCASPEGSTCMPNSDPAGSMCASATISALACLPELQGPSLHAQCRSNMCWASRIQHWQACREGVLAQAQCVFIAE